MSPSTKVEFMVGGFRFRGAVPELSSPELLKACHCAGAYATISEFTIDGRSGAIKGAFGQEIGTWKVAR